MLLIQVPLLAGYSSDSDTSAPVFKLPAMKTDQWFSRDKAQHLIANFYLTGVTKLTLQKIAHSSGKKSLRNSVLITLSISVFKEYHDSRSENNYFSVKDLVADLAGLVIAILVFR